MQPLTMPVPSVWSRGMVAVLSAQFLSAFGDNALLFAALALLRIDRYPGWSAPLLQEFFVASYVLLAPFVGPFADSRSKGQVMFYANGLKILGSLGMLAGVNPFLAYGLVGVGAAAYSPAKYGILSELTSTDLLVKANGLMEASTIAAILLGAVAGGVLADWHVLGALAVVAAFYAAAALCNLAIPSLPAARPMDRWSLLQSIRNFSTSTRRLLRVPDAGFSIAGTSLFWGIGSTLRFLLVAWVPFALGNSTNRMPAFLNAVVAVGIVVGAAFAARFVTLNTVARSLPAGVVLGAAVCLLAGVNSEPMAFVAMIVIGACGGFFVVPLNAVLQDRGHRSVGSGNAIAIQHFSENALMILMLGLYTVVSRNGAPVNATAVGFGAALSLAIVVLWVHRARAPAATA